MTWIALALIVWLLAGLAAAAPGMRHAARLRLGLALVGIPLLGALTALHGPLAGLLGLGLGTLMLAVQRRPDTRRARRPE